MTASSGTAVERIGVRMRTDSPHQSSSGSRNSSGTCSSSAGVVTGCSSPASLARQRLARSVVTSRSAGVPSPSDSSRSKSSGAVPPRSSSDLPVSSSHWVNTVSSPYCDRPL